MTDTTAQQRELFYAQEATISKLLQKIQTLTNELEVKMSSNQSDEITVEELTSTVEDLKVLLDIGKV